MPLRGAESREMHAEAGRCSVASTARPETVADTTLKARS